MGCIEIKSAPGADVHDVQKEVVSGSGPEASAVAPSGVTVGNTPGKCGSATDKCSADQSGFSLCCQDTESTHVCCDQYSHCSCEPGHRNCRCVHSATATLVVQHFCACLQEPLSSNVIDCRAISRRRFEPFSELIFF